MRRYVTYLYEYENSQKIKNVGFLRVDIRNQMVNLQVNIRFPELANETGTLYILVRDGNVYSISLGEIEMKEGLYQGIVNCRYQALGESPYTFTDAVGVGIRFKGGCYLASSWKDDADEVIAKGEFVEYGTDVENMEDFCSEMNVESRAEEDVMAQEEYMEAAALVETDSQQVHMYEESFNQDTYRKINLNEIATLPSSNWYYTNNSFLIHGFWNYGYLVLKETMEAGEKKLSLGVPGIFEQPEMVMATYFGFPTFAALPSQVVEMVIGETYRASKKEKNQEPKVGTFGCWFVNL